MLPQTQNICKPPACRATVLAVFSFFFLLFMKRITAALGAIALAFFVAGCGSADQTQTVQAQISWSEDAPTLDISPVLMVVHSDALELEEGSAALEDFRNSGNPQAFGEALYQMPQVQAVAVVPPPDAELGRSSVPVSVPADDGLVSIVAASIGQEQNQIFGALGAQIGGAAVFASPLLSQDEAEAPLMLELLLLGDQ